MERCQAEQHIRHRGKRREPNGLHHALALACAVIIGNDRNHTVVKSEDRHKDEALQLEINAEHVHRIHTESAEHEIHAERHHRADRLHQNRRNADDQNLLDQARLREQIAKAKRNAILLFFPKPYI